MPLGALRRSRRGKRAYREVSQQAPACGLARRGRL